MPTVVVLYRIVGRGGFAVVKYAVRFAVWGLAVGLFAGPAFGQPPAATVVSAMTVTVPQDDAELLIEGRPTTTTGTERAFKTPPLDAGKVYEYEFKLTWRPNNYTVMSRTRTVQFKAGEPITVNLTRDVGTEKAVIRYVPTPDDIVAKMIELAKIGKNDVAYELGCGDARIAVAAVKAGAKKAVGIDIDPDRIEDAKATVKEADVADKVEIRLGDALDVADLGNADVVFLYMGNEFNMLARPVLWKQLKAGSRIVSHRFVMGDWEPEKTIKVTGDDGDEYELHLWTVTAEDKKKAGK